MDAICHRCGTGLESEDTFCPNCGAPQLRFEPNEETASYAASLRQGYGVHRPNSIRWRKAIGAAITFSVPMGLMSSNLLPLTSLGCCLWIIGGAMATVALYRRRANVAAISTKAGVRIGFVAGLMAALATTAFSALAVAMERFVFHRGNVIDSTFQAQLEQLVHMAQSNPDPQGQMQEFIRFLATPDGRAAWILAGTGTLGAGIIVFSTLGGALGARFFGSRSSGYSS